MIGTVLSFDEEKASSYYPGKNEYEYVGVISVNGGERFRFKMGQWKESEHPAAGDIVDFAAQSHGKEATEIYWEAEYGKAVKRLYLTAEYLTEVHLAASIARSIAAPGHHRIVLQRTKKKRERASFGKVFDFVMIIIAISIVLFFYYISQEQGKRYRTSLDPGYAATGSPPSPPPPSARPPSPRMAAGRPAAAA